MTDILLALLMNPASGSGARSQLRVEGAAQILGYGETQIRNLLSAPSSGFGTIEMVGSDWEPWEVARGEIRAALPQAGGVLLGWGLGGFGGQARNHHLEQVRWVKDQLRRAGVPVWQVGEKPNHPSRWHQYLADRHGRTSGGSFEARLRELLQRVEV